MKTKASIKAYLKKKIIAKNGNKIKIGKNNTYTIAKYSEQSGTLACHPK